MRERFGEGVSGRGSEWVSGSEVERRWGWHGGKYKIIDFNTSIILFCQ